MAVTAAALSGVDQTGQARNFQFLDLQGVPQGLRREVIVIRSPGADGVGIWRDGRRGRPHRVRTFCDSTGHVAAQALMGLYRLAIGSGAWSLWWHGQTQGLYAVLDVVPVSISQLANASGGFNDPIALALVVADWQLIKIS